MKIIFLIMFGCVFTLGFTGLVFAEHDPNQPLEHSIILPPDMKEKTFDEFMEWCVPFYGDKCVKLEKNRIPKVLSPLKQFKLGIPIYEIQCKESLILLEKHDGSPACVKSVTKQHLIDRGWAETRSIDEIQNNSNLLKQNIIRIGDGRISLYPENTCASLDLELLSESDIQRYKNDKKGLDDTNILKILPSDLNDIPDIEILIHAVHSIEFPYNDSVHIIFDGVDFVDYEFFLMDKMIEKYGGTQQDYFMKLDADYEERLTNPKLQGFSNEFRAPQIVYLGNVYAISGTFFWTSDEHNLRMSIHLKDSINDTRKSVILTDDDMKSIPKIKDAIENIGTVEESIFASKGLPEDQWNQYREWFKQKSQNSLNSDRFRLIQYDDHLYSIGFGIC